MWHVITALQRENVITCHAPVSNLGADPCPHYHYWGRVPFRRVRQYHSSAGKRV